MARSKPFSGKKKKDQLKEKKERKRIENAILENNLDISIQEKRKMAKELIKSNANKSINNNQHILSSKLILPNSNNNNHNSSSDNDDNSSGDNDDEDQDTSSDSDIEIEKSISHIKEINKQMEKFDKNSNSNNNNSGRRLNKLLTIFEKESTDEIELRKQNSKKPLDTTLREKPWLIMNEYNKENQINNNNQFIDIPKRPKWNYNMSADKLKEEERLMFSNWLSDMVKKYEKKRLNYFEHNLEVWRQLWRVSERSDVILLITDARYPLFHFPPSLYNYIHLDLKKPMILVLNKTDLVNKNIVDSWIEYFTKNYPSLKVICFSSFSSFEDTNLDYEDVTKKRKMKKGRKRYDLSRGKQNLIEAIKSLSSLGNKSNLITNEDLNQDEKNQNNESEDDFSDTDTDDDGTSQDDYDQDDFDSYYSDYCNSEKKQQQQQQQEFITIGMVGHPNVGKSSLINGLMGKKVVSTSRTPGHTKHFQTIVFSKNIQLLDCPGLVFPALDRPKQLQILCGLFPIAQVREPFSAIQYLSERVPVEQIYRLKNPNDNEPWSAYSICEAFALKRGYHIAKSGRPDPHRAGLELLKDCVDGNIVISWPPPGTTKEEYIKLFTNSNHDDNDNDQFKNQKDKSNLQQPISKSTSKYNKKLKKKNLLKKIAYSDDDDDDDEIIDKEIDDNTPIDQDKFIKSPKPTAFMSLNSISSNDESDTGSNDLDESDNYSEKEEEQQQQEEEEEEEQKKNSYIKSNKNNNNNKSTTSTTSTSTTSINKKKKKSNIKHETEYQERLKEKQNKGGNRRQIV